MFRYTFFFIIIITHTIFADSIKSEQLVNEAWAAWDKNDQVLVEQKFIAAIAENKENTRAYLGLTLLYSMQTKNRKALETFKEFIPVSRDYKPYFFALMTTPIMEYSYPTANDLTEVFKKIIADPDSMGILKVMTYERLQSFYERMGKKVLSDSASADMNTVNQWMVIGPFDNISGSGFDKVYPPEIEFIDKTYEGKDFCPVSWFNLKSIRKDNWIDFLRYFGNYNSVYYANTFVYSPTGRTINLRIGTSGSLKAYLNDQVIFNVADEYNNDVDTYIAETHLNSGWNKLLIKCGLSDLTNCNFLTRITDGNGNKIDGLKFSVEKQAYGKNSAPVKIFNNFAVEYFKKSIVEHPDYPENYILLAECYLRNDYGVDAELILKKATEKFPGCMLFYFKLYEAYLRSHKEDDAENVLIKINDADPLIPDILAKKLAELRTKNDIEKIENLISAYEKNNPDSISIMGAKLILAAAKKDMVKMHELMNSLYELAPYNNSIALGKAYFEYQLSKDINKGIDIIDSLVNYDYNKYTLSTLAEYYLQASMKNKWSSTYDKIIELDPSDTQPMIKKADVFIAMQSYDKAAELIKRALEISPRNSDYWEKLGVVYVSSNMKENAVAAFENALLFNPRAYDSREKLRELKEKKSIFSDFDEPEIESQIKNSPVQSDYPGSNAVILTDNTGIVMYGKGASEKLSEILIKVFTKKGIDNFKEYHIPPKSRETLIIDDAYIIKKDGTKIKADTKEYNVYFKSLEEDDFIYIKYRTRNYYEGSLSNHFWDSFLFNNYYPIKKVQYSILACDNIKFEYKTKNFKLEPVIGNCKDGKIYKWSLENEPAIKEENDMPPLVDVGKRLLVSTIPDWNYLVEWYLDITKNKYASSYEIKEQVKNILLNDKPLTDDQKIERIFNFITHNIRYSSLSFRQSGLIPQKARDILNNKIGDCKDVTTLFISMLAETGIKANYVLVNTTDDGKNDDILPSLEFNHCIAEIESGNSKKYFDLTADNFDCNTLPVQDNNAFSLLIKEGNKSPEYITPDSVIPEVSRVHFLGIEGNNSIVDSICTTKTGVFSAYYRDEFRYSNKEEQFKSLISDISDDYPTAKILSFEPGNTNEITPVSKYIYKIALPSYLTEAAGFKFFKLPWIDLQHSSDGVSYDNRNYPLLLWGDPYRKDETIHLKLPSNYMPVENKYEINLTCSAADYSNKFEYKNGELLAKRTMLHKKTTVMPEEYKEYKEFLNKVLKEDARQILLKENN